MNHHASAKFWRAYDLLPRNIQSLADRNFARLKADPKHPSLALKQVGRYWSVRVGISYRALAVPIEDGLLWFWIGPHTEYDRLVR